jgi:sulfide dehydrogenase cytochrome subunit
MRTVTGRAILAAVVLASGAASAQSVPSAAQGCNGCHGPAGEGAGSIPAIAGTLDRDAFLEAMRQFRADQRPATIMNRISRGFTDAELAQMADLFARRQ